MAAFWERYRRRFLGAALPLAMTVPAWSADYQVTSTADTSDPGTLRWAIEQANANPAQADKIIFNLPYGHETIELSSYLPVINKAGGSLEIIGQGTTVIDGQSQHRPFFVNAGTVTISNLTIQDGMAQGGNGGNATATGGGGGLGAGGAIFVRAGASVTVDSVNFLGNAAAGGQGGTNGGGSFVSSAGGGGLGGNGGSGVGQNAGGGGGGAFSGQDGQAASGNAGGDGGGPNGGVGGAGTGSFPGQAGGEFSGGGGGGGTNAASGGTGGFGGGGGGATSYLGATGGDGGFGGGGGSSPIGSGNGGFGGGGGGAFSGQGTGGFGGGNGSGQNGGGGAAFGGAIFVMEGASLTVKDSGFSQGSVTVGLGGGGNLANAGMAAGSAFFLQDTDVTIDVTGNNEVTIADTIADADGNSQPGGIIKTGTGTLILSGTNTYTGGTSFNEGVVAITSGDNLGTGPLNFNGGTLRADTSLNLTKDFNLLSGGGTIDTNGFDSTLSGLLTGTGDLTKIGAGALGLSGTHAYSGDILLNAGTLALSGGYTSFGNGSIQANGGSLFFGNDVSSQSLANDIVLNSDLVIERNNSVPGGGDTFLYGDLSGSGELTFQKTDGSNGVALWLQGDNSGFNGALNIQDGWVIANSANSLNQQNDVAIADGAGLAVFTNREVVIGDLTGEGEVILYDGTKVMVGSGNDAIFDGRFTQMTGTGDFEKVGTGSLTLTGANAWNGHALLHGGTTTVSEGSLIGSTSAFYDKDIANNATVVFDQDTDGTYDGIMSGSGILVKTGTGTVTLSETNTYQGGTSLDEGVLAISSDANLGTGALNFNGGTLRTNASMTTSKAISLDVNGGAMDTNGFDSTITTNSFAIGGVGTFTKTGEGTLTIRNDFGIAADVVVDGGTLQYADQGGYFGSMTVTVNDGGLFRASSAAPNVVVNNGGSLEAGTATNVGYVYLGSLTMNDGAILNMRLGQPDVEGGSYNDFFYVIGDVTLDGTLNLSNSQSTEFEFGTYNLMSYTGTLANNGITVGDMPDGITDAELQFLADTKQVNVVLGGALFFNGVVTDADGTIHGGSGVWDDTTTNWTNPGGTTEKAWKDKVGVFAGSNGGTVAVVGEQTFTGLQFSTDGYELVAGNDGSLLLNGNGQIRVDDDITATIEAPLTGTGSLEKLDDGTLILGGANTYTGGTTVTGGTLQGDTNSLQGDITNNSYLVFDQSFDGSFDDTIGGTGTLVKDGSGTVALSGTNVYSGGTTINGGTLAVTSDVNLGDVSGDLTFNGGTLRYGSDASIERKIILESNGGTVEVIDGVGAPTISGEISGTGSLTIAGPGSLFLANGGVNSYSGGTILNSGNLYVFQDANLGDVSGDLTLNGGSLVFRETATFVRDVVLGGDAVVGVADGVTTTLTGEISGLNALNVGSPTGGTLVLDGTNTYTGGTNVLGGTLRLGSHGTLASTGDLAIEADGIFDLDGNTQTVGTLSGAGGLLLGDGELTTDTSADSTFSGIIGGTGSLTKDGSGTLTLSGENTYSGGTTVSGGILRGTSASLRGDILNNASIAFAQDTAGTYSGDLSGTGSLVKEGVGALILSGSNSYSGGTTVSDGLLQGTTTSLQGDILNNASVVFSEDVTGTYAGDMSGTGILGKYGTGILILSGTNTYSGGTFVAEGTLQGTTASLRGDIENNAVVVFDQSTAGTYDGFMSGTGSLTKSGNGTLILSGPVSYTGGTLVSAGTLQGNTDSLQGDIENNAHVVFDQSTDGTFQGILGGSGSLAKTGTGVLELIGTQTYTGGTTVQAGELKINGLLASVVAVEADGRLSGIGVLGGLNNQGLLAPGNSIGTMVVNGNAQFQSTGTLEIEINDASAVPQPGVNNDVIDVQGTAELGGTVNVVADNVAGDFANGSEFYFLRASEGFGGSEFDGITDNLAFFDAILGYRQGTASEEFAYFWLKANETNFKSHAFTKNRWQIANFLDRNYHSATGKVEALYNQLMGMTNEQLSSAFDQMTGEVHASLAQLAIQNMLQNQLLLRQNLFGNSAAADWLAARDSSAPIIDANGNALVLVRNPETGESEWAAIRAQDRADWRGWISGYGVGGTAGGDGNASSAKYAIGGTTFGADREIDSQTRLGLYGSYANLNIDTRNGLQSTESDAVQFGGYLLRNHQDARYTLASFGIGFNDYDSRRSVLGQTATGETNGWQANTWLEHGLRFETKRVTLQPFTALQYLYVGQNDFREDGAGVLNLDVDGLDTHALRGVLGASIARPFETGHGLLVPTFHAMWLHEFLDTSSVLNTSFASVGGSGFATRGLDYGRDWAVLGSGLQWETGRNWSVLLNYDIQFNAVQTFHMGSGAVQFQW